MVGPATVLVVDDEAEVRRSLQRLFESLVPGIRAVTAETGRVGLEVLRREPVRLVVSDYRMPGMNGIEFLAEVRRRWPNVPQLMLTAHADADLAQQAKVLCRVDAFLAKTAGPDEILSTVKRLLRLGVPP